MNRYSASTIWNAWFSAKYFVFINLYARLLVWKTLLDDISPTYKEQSTSVCA